MPRPLVTVLGSVIALVAYGTAGCATNKCAPASVVADATAAAVASDAMVQVAKTLDRFHAAAAAADESGYFALFAEGGVFMGTDATERWTVPEFRAYAHPRFASGKAWSFESVHREIAVRGDTAWFDESLDTPNLGPSRGSGVLTRDRNGDWKVAQYNLSVPIPNDCFKSVKTVIEGQCRTR